MNRTLIYARVSTEDQADKYGIPAQIRACREYAARESLSIIGEIVDDGVSGATLERSGLTRLREMVSRGEADAVLSLDPDRLSRELAHLLVLKPELERHARVEFVTGKFEDSPAGRLFFSMKGAIGQYERENTRARTMRGSRERARTGKFCGGRVAYGYRYENGVIVPDEITGQVVREIYAWFLSGLSMRGITRRLRERGTPAWGGKRWAHASIRRILVNETYAGVAYYGKHYVAADGKQRRRTDTEMRIAFPVPSIIDRATWERVQAQVALCSDARRNPSIGRPSASAYLLRGLLYCHCGRRMGAESVNNWRAYRCYGRDGMQTKGMICRATIAATQVDAGVWRALTSSLGDPVKLCGLIAERERELRESARPEMLDALSKRISRLRGKEQRLLSLMCDPDLEHDRATIKRQYLDAQRERLGLDLELNQAQAALAPKASWVDETVSLLAGDLAMMTDPGDRQAFVRGVVTRAEWAGGDQIRLHCFLSGKTEQAPYHLGHFPDLQFVVNARACA